MVILLKYIGVGLTSNNLIQVVYSGLDKDGILEDGYFINRSILFAWNYDIADPNKRAIHRFFRISYVYLSANITIMKDSAKNSDYLSTEYLNSLSPSRLLPFNL